MSEPIPSKLELIKEGDWKNTFLHAHVANPALVLLNCVRQMEIDGYTATWSDVNVVFSKSDRTRTPSVDSGGGGEIEQFEVQSVHRDHLECKRATLRPSDGAFITSGDIVRIAKPWEIRMMGWDNVGIGIPINGYNYTYSAEGTDPEPSKNPYTRRVATLVDGSEFGAEEISWNEEVWPPYHGARTIIYAMKVKQAPLFSVTEDGATYNLEWLDLNNAGRRFEARNRKLKVCVEGQTGPWFIAVRASNSFQEE